MNYVISDTVFSGRSDIYPIKIRIRKTASDLWVLQEPVLLDRMGAHDGLKVVVEPDLVPLHHHNHVDCQFLYEKRVIQSFIA